MRDTDVSPMSGQEVLVRSAIILGLPQIPVLLFSLLGSALITGAHREGFLIASTVIHSLVGLATTIIVLIFLFDTDGSPAWLDRWATHRQFEQAKRAKALAQFEAAVGIPDPDVPQIPRHVR